MFRLTCMLSLGAAITLVALTAVNSSARADEFVVAVGAPNGAAARLGRCRRDGCNRYTDESD